MKLLRYLGWALRVFIFTALFLFALKNTDPVTLRFYFDQSWQPPLVLLLLGFFAGGIAVGVLATLGRVFRQRREILQLRRDLRARGARAMPVAPVADVPVDETSTAAGAEAIVPRAGA